MQVKLTGHIKRIAETQHFGENFCKRSVIIETQEKYPQVLEIELHQDRVDLIDPYTEGEKATFHINVRGREWTSPKSEVRYFITLIAWKIEKTDTSSNGQNLPSRAKKTKMKMICRFNPHHDGNWIRYTTGPKRTGMPVLPGT